MLKAIFYPTSAASWYERATRLRRSFARGKANCIRVLSALRLVLYSCNVHGIYVETGGVLSAC